MTGGAQCFLRSGMSLGGYRRGRRCLRSSSTRSVRRAPARTSRRGSPNKNSYFMAPGTRPSPGTTIEHTPISNNYISFANVNKFQ